MEKGKNNSLSYFNNKRFPEKGGGLLSEENCTNNHKPNITI
jgi:hypothetical protein